jgi:hypothetical protein
LEAKAAEHVVVDRETESANRKAADRKSWALLFATILVALLVWVVKGEEVVLGRLGKATEIATSNAPALLALIIAYVVLVWILNPTHSRAKNSFIRDTLELSNVHRVGSMVLFIVLGASALGAALIIAWPAALNVWNTVASLVQTIFLP